ncbi:MAG: hypothetical protein EAX86_03885 [Candidatus Heimdallarchaeota archaeon]|nr:hypothetical protein [Candidatus Heimdallarchaeota archaeon]
MITLYSILCIGDSHTAGFPLYDPLYGGNPKSSYQYWLSELLNSSYPNIRFEIDNKGICGQTTKEITLRLKGLVSNRRYHMIIYCGGANDIAMGYSVDKIWKNMEEALKTIHDLNIKFFLLTIPPMNWSDTFDQLMEINNNIMNLKMTSNYIPVDIHTALKENGYLNRSFNSGDGVHLSIQGYKQIATVIHQAILEIL